MHVLGEFARGLVVIGATAHIRLLCPPGTILQYLGLLRKTGQTRLLLAVMLCLMKCILASISGSTLTSIVFSTLICFWTL